ncbi:MAG: hypothetical protein D6812_05810 [Deltaproteobacteria bacterium]|nr:MAG: hypothetical protein D6812_05810 [Deltaproteobacteria bacterium]
MLLFFLAFSLPGKSHLRGRSLPDRFPSLRLESVPTNASAPHARGPILALISSPFKFFSKNAEKELAFFLERCKTIL